MKRSLQAHPNSAQALRSFFRSLARAVAGICTSTLFAITPFAITLFGTEVRAENYAEKRAKLSQVVDSMGIESEAVLKRIREVPRHKFMPEKVRSFAYLNRPLPIGHKQTISQPYIVALMTELLQPKESDTVLEIGTGSGYQAAVLATLVEQVYTIEIIPELGKQAATLLQELGYSNVKVRIGDGYRGWPSKAPFDKIILTAAPPKIPQPLLEQLKEGGRMVVPVGTHFQELLLITKVNGEIQRKRIEAVRFVPMTGEAQRQSE